jgi:hypothetical protein
MMFTTWNITSKTPQDSCHIKDINLCNEKKKSNHQHQGIYPRDQTKNNYINISKESNSPCESNLVTFLF